MDKIGTQIETRRIGVLTLNGFALMSYSSTVEPLRAANLLGRRTLYDVVNIGMTSDPIPSSGAAVVMPQATIADAPKLDYLFVVAGGDPAQYNERPLFPWLVRLARAGTRLGGVSGGPLVLARAGLMQGRRMTVHWEHAQALAEISPHLMIDRTLYVIDRDRVTCAGGTAPLDLMHALIARHHGAPFARMVSDWFMHTEIRPSIGPQRGGLMDRVGSTNPVILDSVKAMESNVAEPVGLEELAAAAGVSPRQLNRLFREKLGRSTMGYYRELRLDKAQSLLRNSPLSLTEIALATGFANSSHFSRAFTQHFGQPPSASR
ncbi:MULTISPECIES: GlxA family transcriptional regulator [unclassified Roseovarius]|uniref:GlxA family transcriptional regulator n=1 Tax=unclassified Roseovarius TaxID=2614913 RepID=UPI00273E193C|nr:MULTISPECIES: GlxA family transcriptional regulator [unclassified Roseovarius]